ncbi:MAG: hypothetical protein HOL80_01015 [Candidatus Magasanikbacteria bacterium]|nr:hypothetical protein [Candidatus Magasanikbacteria bacterium]MBT5262461.1 hypothetical protein [Candidatus Magasanikbacteria bacterium]MBT5820456.1 hypothetical protein [Candidatus Magasanikbacteria bacterium]MBT6294440.1 hypothetical protein [Candidatus Magasanikbacteria bacterium]
MTQREVVALMKSSKSEIEWNTNRNKVKKACGGYPDFWYTAIVLSGVAAETAKNFGGSADITITAI